MPTARINDINMHYEVHGDGEPLLMLHGLGSSRDDWENQVPVFAEHFKVITPSLRGFGDTDKPSGPYSVRQYADDAFALMDHLEIEQPHLLGFSMGGAIAFQMAVDCQHRIRSMVILNSQPSFELDHWRKHWLALVRIIMANFMGMQRTTRFVSKRLFPEPHQEHLRKRMLERHGNNDKNAYLAALNALKGWSVTDWVAGIHVPTLVIAAEEDYTPVEEKERFVANMPNAALKVIRNSRHATHFDRPETFNRMVVEFLLQHQAVAPRKRGYGLLRWLRLPGRQRDDADARH